MVAFLALPVAAVLVSKELARGAGPPAMRRLLPGMALATAVLLFFAMPDG